MIDFDKTVRLALSGGAGFAGELGPLPIPGNFGYQSAQIPNRFAYGTVQLSGPAKHLSRGDKNAFQEAVAITLDGMLEEFRLLVGIAAYGWGAGIIGVVGSVSGNNITLADDVHPGFWYQENWKIDSYASDEATLHTAAMVVTAVDPIGRVITVNNVGATVATDRLVMANGLNIVPHGLMAAVDDGTYVGNYMNIPRASFPKWRSYVDSSQATPVKYGSTVRRALTGDLIQKGIDLQRGKAGAARGITHFITDLPVRRQYWNSLSPDRRFPDTMYDGGWELIKFSAGDRPIGWYADELCYRYTMYQLHLTGVQHPADRLEVPPMTPAHKVDKVQDEELMAIYQSPYGAMEWDEDWAGGVWKPVYSGSSLVDAGLAFLKWYYNVATCAPRIHTRIDDILET